jgi:hypothetical protein
MARTVEITLPAHGTDALVARARGLHQVIGIRVQRGASVQPPGDVVTISLTNDALRSLIHVLDELGITSETGASITVSEPTGLISPARQEAIESDESDVIWEEMEFSVLRESNMDRNGVFVMFASGVIAAVGIATGAVHLVVGAMVIAPGFKPITRLSLGMVASGRGSWYNGARDTLVAYASLLVGAIAAALVLRLNGTSLLTGSDSYLASEALVSFWLEITLTSLVVAGTGGAVGAILIAVNRSVLTAGVMIALALIPPPVIAGLALVAGDLDTAGRGLLRWAVEVLMVAATGVLVFAWKRAFVQRRSIAT